MQLKALILSLTILILTTLSSVSKAGTTSSTVCTENDLGDETCVTTTTTTTTVPSTDTGNVLTNSTFGTSGTTYSTSGWTIVDDHGGVVHNGTFGTTYSGQNTTGGTLAADDDMQIYQEVDLVGDGHLTKSQINEGFTSTMSADIWFWSGYQHNVQLKQTITDDNGNVTTQIRNITDTSEPWKNYTDSYTQSSNTQADYSIKAEMTSTCSGTGCTGSVHQGPDIDNIELGVVTAGTTSTSTSTSSVTTLCQDRVPNACTYDQSAVEDAVDLKTDDGKDLITVVDEDIKEAVKDFETVSVDTTVIVEDDLGKMEEVKFDEFVEQQFSTFIEENNLTETFETALVEEGLTEEEFYEELSTEMEEEFGMNEDFKTEEPKDDLAENTAGEEEIKEEEITEETNTTETVEKESTNDEATNEKVEETPNETNQTGEDSESVSEESDMDKDSEAEGTETETSDDEAVEDEQTGDTEEQNTDVKADDVAVKVKRIIEKLEKTLKSVDDKVKAVQFVTLKGMQSGGANLSSYAKVQLKDTVKLFDGNPDFFNQLNIEQEQIYKDVSLNAYTNNDPISIKQTELNRIDIEKKRLLLELRTLREG